MSDNRAMRRWAPLSAAVLVASAALTACGSNTVTTRGNRIQGLRTDADGSGLVASYIGGACDTSARLELRERQDRISASVVITSKGEACSAVGISRTVSARLATPVGQRQIVANGLRQIPFDGSRLLVPAALPATFALRVEEGSDEPAPAPDAGATAASPSASQQLTTTWTRLYSPPDPGLANATACGRSRGNLLVIQGPATGLGVGADSQDLGIRMIGAAPAHLFRDGDTDATASGWTLVWSAAGGTVEVTSQASCAGDPILSADQITQVARSLHS